MLRKIARRFFLLFFPQARQVSTAAAMHPHCTLVCAYCDTPFARPLWEPEVLCFPCWSRMQDRWP